MEAAKLEQARKEEYLRMKNMVMFLESSCKTNDELIKSLRKDLEDARGGPATNIVPGPATYDEEILRNQIRFLHYRVTEYRKENTELRDQLGLGSREKGPLPQVFGPERPPGPALPVMHFREQVQHQLYILKADCEAARANTKTCVASVMAVATSALTEMREKLQVEMLSLVAQAERSEKEIAKLKTNVSRAEKERDEAKGVAALCRTQLEEHMKAHHSTPVAEVVPEAAENEPYSN